LSSGIFHGLIPVLKLFPYRPVMNVSGMNIVAMESGDPGAYEFVPQCVTEFEVR
jgi:hypothetical protein